MYGNLFHARQVTVNRCNQKKYSKRSSVNFFCCTGSPQISIKIQPMFYQVLFLIIKKNVQEFGKMLDNVKRSSASEH